MSGTTFIVTSSESSTIQSVTSSDSSTIPSIGSLPCSTFQQLPEVYEGEWQSYRWNILSYQQENSPDILFEWYIYHVTTPLTLVIQLFFQCRPCQYFWCCSINTNNVLPLYTTIFLPILYISFNNFLFLIRNKTKYHHIEPYKSNHPYLFLPQETSFH